MYVKIRRHQHTRGVPLAAVNQCVVQMGRSPETSCYSVCLDLESLAPSSDGAAEDAACGGGNGGAGGPLSSCVRVLLCWHQFHYGCLSTRRLTALTRACPVCKK